MHLSDQFNNSVNKPSDIEEIKQDLINIKKSLTDIVSLISKYKD